MTKFSLQQIVQTCDGEGVVVEIESASPGNPTVYYVDVVAGDRQRHHEKSLRGLNEDKPWKIASIRLIMGVPDGDGMVDTFDDPKDAEATLMRWVERMPRWGGVIYIEDRLHIGIWRDGKAVVREVAHPPFAITKNPYPVADSVSVNTHIPSGHIAI